MDPLSFAASLATVAAAVTTSSQIIYNFYQNFRDVPKEVQSLSEQLEVFKGLLEELGL